MKRTIVAIKMW